MSDNNLEVILIRESTLQSLCSDLSTFGVIVFSFWINYKFIGGDGWLSFLLALLSIFWIWSGAAHLHRKSVATVDQAIDRLNKMKEKNERA